MSVGSGGEEYEKEVLKVIKPEIKKLSGFSIKEGTSTAAFAANVPDLQLVIHGKTINIEIKQDSKAQMGGGSFNYNMKKEIFSLSGKTAMAPAIEEKLIEILNTKRKDLNKLLNFAKKIDIAPLASEVTGLPLRATKDAWGRITSERYLVPLNSKVETKIDFIYDHYEKKNCYYIQIGKAGLYYLKSNPFNLPVPQLSLDFVIELRLGRAGSSLVKSLGVNVSSGNIRAQGRLGGTVKSSPFSLDVKGDFTRTFGSISKETIEKMK